MASIRCKNCRTEKDHSEFLRHPLNLEGKPLKNCSTCRASGRASKKRAAAENSRPVQPVERYRTLAPSEACLKTLNNATTTAPSEAPLQPADRSIAQIQSNARSMTPIQPRYQPAAFTPINPPTLLNSLPVQPAKRYRTLAPSEASLPSADQSIAQMQSDADGGSPPSSPVPSRKPSPSPSPPPVQSELRRSDSIQQNQVPLQINC